MHNIEIKIKLTNHYRMRTMLEKNHCTFIRRIRQIDTYYRFGSERLKIREIDGTHAECIRYRRANAKQSRLSSYIVIPLTMQRALVIKKIFEGIFGRLIIVKKQREFWKFRHTRIHLDTVYRLGTFLELETVVKRISRAQAQNEHKLVASMLHLAAFPSIAVSYSDLMLKRQ